MKINDQKVEIQIIPIAIVCIRNVFITKISLYCEHYRYTIVARINRITILQLQFQLIELFR